MEYPVIPCNTMQYHAIPCIIINCWRSVPLPCGQYMAIFGAPVVLQTIPCSFMSRYVCPVLVSFLAISATLIVTVSILYWNYSETMYVLIITIITPGTQVPRYQVPRYLLLSNLFRPRYRRATKKSTVLDHWGKKVHFLVNLIDLKSCTQALKYQKKSCIQVLLKFYSGPWEGDLGEADARGCRGLASVGGDRDEEGDDRDEHNADEFPWTHLKWQALDR